MTTTVSPDQPLRLRTPRDVLATVPRLLGYRPQRSIVFLNVHEGGRASTLRVDLPEPHEPDVEKGFVASLTGMLCKVPGVRGTIIAVYADGPYDAGGDAPRASFVRALIGRLLDSGFAVYDALCVAEDGWGAYDGHDAGVLHALDELDHAVPGSESAPVAADASELAAVPQAGFLARQSFDASFDRAVRESRAVRPVAAADAALELDPATADDDELASVLTLLLDPELRDVALFTWAWGAARGAELLLAAERLRAGELSRDSESILLDLMGLGDAEPPDRERIGRASALMCRIAALASDDVAHIPLTVLAWLHWSQGRGTPAGRLIERALELEPQYGLAELLAAAIGRGMLPEWAYVDPTLPRHHRR